MTMSMYWYSLQHKEQLILNDLMPAPLVNSSECKELKTEGTEILLTMIFSLKPQ